MKQPYYLIVDDDMISRFITQKFLSDFDNGFQIREAVHGKAALEEIERSGLPSLIFLDLNMPVMNGFDVLEHFSAHPVLSSCPVAIITSSIHHADKLRCDAHKQIIGYLKKPFSEDDIRMILDKVKAA